MTSLHKGRAGKSIENGNVQLNGEHVKFIRKSTLLLVGVTTENRIPYICQYGFCKILELKLPEANTSEAKSWASSYLQ